MRKKRRKHSKKEVTKKAKAKSLQNELDREVRVCEMADGASCSRWPVDNAEGGGFFDPPSTTISISVTVADGMHADDSGTRFEGPRVDVV